MEILRFTFRLWSGTSRLATSGEKISEFWKYHLDSGTWDTLLTDTALEDYAIDRCSRVAKWRMDVERCDKEWEVM